jgi:hypothetical protein
VLVRPPPQPLRARTSLSCRLFPLPSIILRPHVMFAFRVICPRPHCRADSSLLWPCRSNPRSTVKPCHQAAQYTRASLSLSQSVGLPQCVESTRGRVATSSGWDAATGGAHHDVGWVVMRVRHAVRWSGVQVRWTAKAPCRVRHQLTWSAPTCCGVEVHTMTAS